MSVSEQNLLNALSEMENIAKGGVTKNGSGMGNKTPRSTQDANGGFSDEGDKTELAVGPDMDAGAGVPPGIGVAKGDKSFTEWVSEDDEDAQKACKGDDYDDDESMEDEDEDEDKDEKKGGYSKKGSGKEGMVTKGTEQPSIADIMKSDSVSSQALDVAPFLERLVDQVSDSEMELRKSIFELTQEQGTFNNALRKSVVALGNLVLEVKKQVNELGNMPSGDRQSVLHKSELQERFEPAQPDFTKTEVLDVMIDLAKAGEIPSLAVSAYEVSNSMDPPIRKTVEAELRKSLA